MDVQYVDIEELKECEYNPRKFTAKKESELKVARILNLKSISIEKDKNKIQDFLDAKKKYTL